MFIDQSFIDIKYNCVDTLYIIDFNCVIQLSSFIHLRKRPMTFARQPRHVKVGVLLKMYLLLLTLYFYVIDCSFVNSLTTRNEIHEIFWNFLRAFI